MSQEQGIVKNSRVSRPGSWVCGTVITDFGDWCSVQWDRSRDPQDVDRHETLMKRWLAPTTYYNECWNAWKMKEDGIPSVAPEWKGR